MALLALGLGACGWPSLEPDDRAWPVDERMGTEVFRTDHGLRVASTFQDDALQIAFEVIADGWQLVEVDPDTRAITALPPPPLQADATISLGRALPPARAVISDNGGDVHLLEDDAWVTLPRPPLVDAAALGALIAHHGRVYATFANDRVVVWDGAAWTEPLPGARVYLGGFDADTQWLLVEDAVDVAAVPIDASGALGTSVAGPVARLAFASINGDADGFQILAEDRLWWFDGASFVAGSAVTGGVLAAAPGSTRAVYRLDGTYTFADAATLGEVALAPFTAAIDCGCDVATDDACACIAHTVGYVELEVAPTSDRIALTMADAIDGYGVLTARFLDLPYEGDPFSL